MFKRSYSIDATEPLNDANRVPMDVVVDEKIAVLEVLTFGDAISRNKKINFSLGREFSRALLRWRGENA